MKEKTMLKNKVRIWTGEEMLDPITLETLYKHIWDEPCISFSSNHHHKIRKNFANCKWLYFTKLLDINNIEIFEEDIVSAFDPITLKTYFGIIKYSETHFWYALYDSNDKFKESLSRAEGIKIIGNTFQNKDLINLAIAEH